MRREYKTTEFWAVVVGAGLWLADKHLGTNVLDVLADGEAVTAAKAQVAIIADSLRAATGSDSNVIVYGAIVVYIARKAEKVADMWRSDK